MENFKTPSTKANKDFFYKEAAGNSDLNFYHINATLTRDIFPIDVGYEKHPAGKKPFSNHYPYYLLHFVKSGKGIIEFDGNQTCMNKNTLFILPPDKEIRYVLDKKQNWEYYWINFNGSAVQKILNYLGVSSQDFYINCNNSKCLTFFKVALAAKADKDSQFFTVMHCLMQIFEEICRNYRRLNTARTNEAPLFEQILDYVHEHLYDCDLRAKGVADKFFLSPCYFSTLFDKNANVSFKEYINYERIKKATELLDSTELLIKEIAEAVGFSDPLYFGKVFKRYRLVSPFEYRKMQNRKFLHEES